MRTANRIAILTVIPLLSACGEYAPAPGGPEVAGREPVKVVVTLASEGPQDLYTVRLQATCNGKDVSPPQVWKGLPEGTRSISLEVMDHEPETRTRTRHCLMLNLPVEATDPPPDGRPRGSADLSIEAVYGDSERGRYGRFGPDGRPAGTVSPANVTFALAAFDHKLNLSPGFSVSEFDAATGGGPLDTAILDSEHEDYEGGSTDDG